MFKQHFNTLNTAKGRSEELIRKRDEALIERFIYWTETARLRYDDTIKVLSENEFFISESRVLQILRKNADKLNINNSPNKKIIKYRVIPFFKGQ